MSIPVVSGKEVIKVLLKNGFTIKRQKGSHVHLVKIQGSRTLHVTVPVHGNRDLNAFRAIDRNTQAGYLPEDFAQLF